MSSPPSERVRLAIPSKGRIAAPARELLEKSGLHLGEGNERRLIAGTSDPQVEVIFARPADIPEYVANGVADLGITGHDMVRERGAAVEEILDLRFGAARLVVAVPEESRARAVEDLRGARIATVFPRITREFFAGRGVEVRVVQVGGACEATPHLGVADAIVDLTSSGDTLRTHHLRVVEEVLSTSTLVIGNTASLEAKREKVDEIVLALESVVRARGQCYLMMNVRRSSLARIRKVLPGLSGPTVMDVASDEDLVAVHAVVEEDRIYALITQLKRAGARDILVMPIDRMVR
ncbi:MAG: ATP phosphoribosyltransferase [Methanomicrobiales archaeon]|nr:ATP phosphoribosyltransferase [Methanomicrobiales archaeon]MDD1660544.1 ATP phosphoribosyltransferase [Methanomicrobiales archaeon]